jgi:hypothetical protein
VSFKVGPKPSGGNTIVITIVAVRYQTAAMLMPVRAQMYLTAFEAAGSGFEVMIVGWFRKKSSI